MRIKIVGLVSVLLCILQAHGSSILSPSDHEHSPELSSLLEWLKQNGATVKNVKIDKVRDGGLRGLVATANFKAGELVALIPNHCTVDVGHYTLPGAELAVQLLWRQLEYPEWNRTFEPYWNSLPQWGTIYSKENWNLDPDHLALFQEPYLEHYVQVNANWTRDAWAGVAATDKEKQWPHMAAKYPREAQRIPYEQFRHYACLTATYTFVFPDKNQVYQRVMVPLLDLVNHYGIGSNTFVTKNPTTQAYHMVATKDIKKGEEITHTYNMDNERNDYAALNYFFIQRLDPPRLCSIDLPEGHLDASFPEFDDHYLPRDKAAILVRSFTCCHNREHMRRQAHVDYLENKLKSFPTTIAKDDNLLSARKSKLTWLDRRVIEFRKERKWTMQHWAKILRERAKTAYSLHQMTDIEANHNFEHTEL